MSPSLLRAHGIALLTVVIWSLTFVQTKVLLLYLSPVEILIDRFSLAWVLFWVLMPRRRATTIRDEGYFALLGATGIFGYYILENMALKYTTAVHVGLIVTTAPIFTALILMVSRAFDRRYGLGMVGGFMLVAAGLAVMRYDQVGDLRRGDLLALLGALSFGVYSVLLGRVDTRFDVWVVTRKSFFWGVVFLSIFALGQGERFHWEEYARFSVWTNLLFLSVVASGLCFVMWRWSIRQIGAERASNYIYLVPLINAAAAVWILDEQVTVRLVFAGILILGGLVVAQYAAWFETKQ